MIRFLFYFSFFIFNFPVMAGLPAMEHLEEEAVRIDWGNAVSASIIIDAPMEKVWAYASDSTQAVNWSIYFHHISPLPGKFPDGTVGSLRRCFTMGDESGKRWDEVIIEVTPQKSRGIVTYNFYDYGWDFITESAYVFVRQLYVPISAKKTKLTFQTTLPPRFNPIHWLFFKLAKGETEDIFEKNLENIKSAVEGKPRIYLWKKPD